MVLQDLQTKESFGKNNQRQGYHIVLSFKEDEVDADTVFQITKEFVDAYIGERYETVFAVHDNTNHIHSHIVYNKQAAKTAAKETAKAASKVDTFFYYSPVSFFG